MFQQLFLSLCHRSTWATGKKGKEMWDVHLNNQSHKQENLILELGKGEQKNIQVEWLRRKKKVKISFLERIYFWLCSCWLGGGLLLLQTVGLLSSCTARLLLLQSLGSRARRLW